MRPHVNHYLRKSEISPGFIYEGGEAPMAKVLATLERLLRLFEEIIRVLRLIPVL